jgi:dienelactone hydrolase
MRLLLATCIAALAATVGAPERTNDVLMSAPNPEELRARLAVHALAVAPTHPGDAGAAQYSRGVSFARAGLTDSAIACFRLALGTRRSREDMIALVDALLHRHSAADANDAIALLEPALNTPDADGPTAADSYAARLGWAQFLRDRPDSARRLLTPLEEGLSLDPRWRYRLARVALAAADYRRAYILLLPLLVASRHQDEELVKMMEEVGRLGGRQNDVQENVRRAFAERDRIEREAIEALPGRRVRFAASDGEYVSALSLKPPVRSKPPVALILMAAADTIADYGGLGAALRSAGYAVAIVEPRGSGGSTSPNCPLPDTWEGREEALEARVAHDLGDALDALAQSSSVDPSHCIAVGVGTSAGMAVRAADLDSRFAALVLVSPRVPEVERGAMIDQLRRKQLPAYFQLGGEGYGERALVDAYYRAGLLRGSRVSEARRPGRGVAQFVADPTASLRLVSWLKETQGAGAARRATRPSTPRRK